MARPRTTRQSARTAGAGLTIAALAVVAATGAVGCSREPERSVAAYCAQVQSVKDFDQVLAGGDPARTARAAADFRSLRQVAPSEIEAQLGTLAAITDELARTMGTAPDANAAAHEVFAQHQGDLASITDAGAKVELYTADNCHVLLNGTAAPGTTVPGTDVPGRSTTTTVKAQPAVATTAAPRTTTTKKKG